MKQLQVIRFFTILSCFTVLLLCAHNSLAQVNADKKSDTEVQRERQLIREEIQRYFGYETLPIRYLSLPYDSSVNSNIESYYVEIGFLLLMFIPIVLMLGFRKKPVYGIIIMLLTLLLALISTANGTLLKNKLTRISLSSDPAWLNNFDKDYVGGPVDNIIVSLYKISYNLYQPIDKFLLQYSGNFDHITYPILVLLFLLGSFLLDKYLNSKRELVKLIGMSALIFAFLWLAFSAGIIWYGYLVISLLFLFLFAYFSKNTKKGISKIFNYAFISIVIIWLGAAFTLRISNIYQIDKSAGVHIFDAPIVKYQIGAIEENGKRFSQENLIQNYFPGLDQALKGINKNDNLVYSVGTMFPYFIKKNNQRLLNDNLLALFQVILNKYDNDKVTVTKVLKAYGFRYILINLKLYRVDKTPEKSVQQKYKNFMNYVYNNKELNLIATDRIIETERGLEYGLFSNEIKTEGSYAIFKIN